VFTEFLRVKTILDGATAKKMESSLTQRFSRVAKRFGKGLMQVVKGSVLGISIGLLSKLLNPLEAIEEKIKTLLGQGKDLNELADRLGSSPGDLRRLQDVAASLGVDQSAIADMLNKFATTLETARVETDEGKELSLSSQAVKNFANDENIVRSFEEFMKGLNRIGDPKAREKVEREVFGERLLGSQKKLVGLDVASQARKIGLPSENRISEAANKIANLGDIQRAKEVGRETLDFVATADELNKKMITDMEKRAAAEQKRERDRMQDSEALGRAANGINEIKESLVTIMSMVSKAVGYIGDLATQMKKLSEGGFFRRFFGTGK
jgi:hypothetical protein